MATVAGVGQDRVWPSAFYKPLTTLFCPRDGGAVLFIRRTDARRAHSIEVDGEDAATEDVLVLGTAALSHKIADSIVDASQQSWVNRVDGDVDARPLPT